MMSDSSGGADEEMMMTVISLPLTVPSIFDLNYSFNSFLAALAIPLNHTFL